MVLFSKAATYNYFIEALLKILITSLSVKHRKMVKNAHQNFPDPIWEARSEYICHFCSEIAQQVLDYENNSRKKGLGGFLKVKNSGKVGNNDTREKNLLNV